MPGAVRRYLDRAGAELIQGSNDVFTNLEPQVRIGDAVRGHGSGEHAGPVMATGSQNVFTNNIPSCREGDVATCGHPASGSNNVYING